MESVFKTFSTAQKLGLFLGTLITGFLIALLGPFVLILLVAAALVWWLSEHLEMGWYILVLLTPTITWILRFDSYSFLHDYPFLASISAPWVDFWAVILLAALLLRYIKLNSAGEQFELRFPAIKWFGLFILSAVLSLQNIYKPEIILSVKYLIRFIILAYGFLLLGANIIRTKKILNRSLLIFLATSVAAALMGTISFLLGTGREVYGFFRAAPFYIGNWAPFGDQHIFLAETITVTVPVWLFLYLTNKYSHFKHPIWWLFAWVITINLLTFSRAAWVTLALNLGLALVLFRNHLTIKKYLQRWWPGIIGLGILGVLLVSISLTSGAVQSSTSTRWYLTEISWELFTEAPIVGNGVGTFMNRLTDIQFYYYEIGDLTDAHGIIQKIIAEQGLLGLIAFGGFVGFFLFKTYEIYRHGNLQKHQIEWAVLAGFLITTSLTFQLFSTQYYTSKMWVPLALGVAILYFLYEDPDAI